MLPIQFMPVKYNFNKGTNKPKYIVIHDTGNPTASAENHFRYFNGGNRGASAHYFIDQDNIIQIIRDEDSAWHVGDGRGKYGITNSNSIGIEICLPGNKERSVAHAIDLTVELMQKHNIPLDRVVRHYDASRKYCPNFMRSDNWAKWIEFKARVANQLGGNGMKEQDIRNIVRDEMKQLMLGESQIRALVKSEVDKAVKQSKYDTAGTVDTHWAYKDLVELNTRLSQAGAPGISSTNLNDLATRGEVIRMLNISTKTGCSCK
ncbi:N-acetylmuramoyl-L-alanine amidase CwlA precursor [Andreesenia angusta]|uniref:N-acetylmuramoyl-L-alanine amidase n=1 Tax=Andreesenia angusta TaxID=39480 RepID=A0A1S1V8Y0_9FIRM|nr:N-acetylmuramoyl-L-alanine amidase [Andreesenia angusta]OHW63052.1 N-acetylmuramoyl-L-alanine amidase CwlA precursor [Andreesenia angusta]